jgi:two-component system OmpR family sensor kinase
LLALARHEASPSAADETSLVPLDRVARPIVTDLHPQAVECGIDLVFEIVEPLTVRADPVMLATAIRNLLDNAIRYTPKGGRVDVGVYREDDAAVLQVDDTGPGIASDDLDRIFEPFFRGSRPEGDGSGLGLAIVKGVVDTVGGTIALENIGGSSPSGLRALVRLPLAVEVDSVADTAERSPGGPRSV